MFSITVGRESQAHGLCCISIGDNSVTRGAFQVNVTDKLSLPEGLTAEKLDIVVQEVENLRETYKAFVAQGFPLATPEFLEKANAAIEVLLGAIDVYKKNIETPAVETPLVEAPAVETPSVQEVLPSSDEKGKEEAGDN
jgi:hypothetical protein